MKQLTNEEYKTLTTIASGHLIERFDVIISGFFSVIFASIFFPKSDPKLVDLAGFLCFASGFIMRPVGGIIFGHFGDRIGRKIPFVSSVILVTIPTLTIGILPTYEQIGLFAYVIFIACRLLQGFAIGGEYSGAIIYFFENSLKNKKIFGGSLICATGFIGGVLGLSLGAICNLPFMPEWGWRVPFLLGAILGIISYFYRTKVLETPVFNFIKEKNIINRYPLLEVLKKEKRNCICTAAIGANNHILLNSVTIFLPSVLMREGGLSFFEVTAVNAFMWLFWAIVIVVAGYLADRTGKKDGSRIMMASSFLPLLIIYPSLLFLDDRYLSSVQTLILLQLLITLGGGVFFSISASFLPGLFAPEERYTGHSFSINIGQALVGAFSPLVVAVLSSYVSTFRALGFVLILSNLMGYLAVKKAKLLKTWNNDQFKNQNRKAVEELRGYKF